MSNLGLFALLSFGSALAGEPKTGASVPFDGGYPVTSASALFPLEKLTVGARGVGYTVFQGDQVEPFDVEILGLLPSMLGPHRDVILARLSGPKIEFTGVISGMSGSPVYLDGKLLGAVSYRFGSFSKEPIAGITPIGAMLEIVGSGDDAPLAAAPGPWPETRSRATPSFAETFHPPARPVQAGLTPIETPVSFAGLSPAAALELGRVFADAGWALVSGARAGGGPSPRGASGLAANQRSVAGLVPAAPIAPGAPIAALLMRGDLSVAGTGTVTFLDRDQVLAFGHPFFGLGKVAFPMATAAILHTLASEQGSYKQSASAVEVGMIEHDRLTAIGGRLGRVAPMIPVQIETRVRGRSAPIRTEVEIVDHDTWFPIMLQTAVASAVDDRLSEETGGTLDLEADFAVGDRSLRVVDTYSVFAPQRVGHFAARDLAVISSILLTNAYERAKLGPVKIRISTARTIEMAWIEGVIPDRENVRPGETLGVQVTLRPYHGDARSVRLEFPIPADAEDTIKLFVGGALELDHRDNEVYGERLPSTLDDVLGVLAERRPGRGVFGRLYLDRKGLRSSVDLLPSLPLSKRITLAERTTARRGEIKEALGPAASADYPAVVIGSMNLTLRIVR